MSIQKQTLLSEKLLYALEFAAIAHRTQVRKGPKNAPYIGHPAAVGLILSKAGYPEDVVIAGILHDVIEDTEYGYEEIEQAFGKQIAGWVSEVSEDKNLPYDEMKDGYLNHLETASNEAKAVSSADLLANRYEMLMDQRNGIELWQKTPAKNMERDLRRLSIIKPVVESGLAEEVERVTLEVHKHYQEK